MTLKKMVEQAMVKAAADMNELNQNKKDGTPGFVKIVHQIKNSPPELIEFEAED